MNTIKKNSEEYSISFEILSLSINQSLIGISFFDNTKKIITCNEIQEFNQEGFQKTIDFLSKISYDTILIPKNIPLFLKTFLVDCKNNQKLNIISFKSSDYDLENVKTSLFQLNLKNNNDENYNNSFLNHKKFAYLSTKFDFSRSESLKSLGPLINFLIQQTIITNEFSLNQIILQNDSKLVFINKKTLESLQIFKEETHPSLIKGKGKSKEGFSLFNVFESQITTNQGKILLKKWFLNPTFNESLIKYRLETVKDIKDNFGKEDWKNFRNFLKKIYDMGKIVKKFIDVKGKLEDWKKIKSSFESLIKIGSFLKSHNNWKIKEIKIFKKLIEIDLEPIIVINNMIQKCLRLGEEIIKTGGLSTEIEINYGINEELDTLRKAFNQLDDFLELYAKDELKKINKNSGQNSVTSISFSFFPQVGYLILIPKDDIKNSRKKLKISNNYSSTKGSETETINSDFNSKDLISKNSVNESNNFISENTTNNKFYTEKSKYVLKSETIYEVLNEDEDSNIFESQKYLINDDKEEKVIYSQYLSDDNTNNEDLGLMLKNETINYLKEKLPHPKIFHEILNLDQDWNFHFEMENNLYFKNNFTNDLDLAYGDIYEQIISYEQKIVRSIEEEIVKISDFLMFINDIIAEIDCFQAFAAVLREFNLTMPEISENPIFLINQGRHLLTEILLKEQFIPNDYIVYNYNDDYDNNFESNESFLINKNFSNRCGILSGPNFSGKSIFLKQIGIIVFLVHIGSFVPAKYCKIGLVDKILTSIHLNDSVTSNETGLIEELQNLFQLLKLATNRSLILIDEFGKNASHEENLALFLALINNLTINEFPINNDFKYEDSKINDSYNKFRKQYNVIPCSLIITHLKEFNTENLIKENYIIRFLHMQFMIKNKENQEIKQFSIENGILYLYKMSPGFSLNSFAIFLAKNIIKEEYIIKRAFYLHQQIINGEPLNPIDKLTELFLNTTKSLISNIKTKN